jgi:hypothetical protein
MLIVFPTEFCVKNLKTSNQSRDQPFQVNGMEEWCFVECPFQPLRFLLMILNFDKLLKLHFQSHKVSIVCRSTKHFQPEFKFIKL